MTSDSPLSPTEYSSPLSPIVLIGFMGCGKSSVARALGLKLHLPVVDLDSLLEGREGMTIAQIFATRGEAQFRTLETTILGEALQNTQPRIIATGGGIVLREENRVLLKQAAARGVLVVYIRAEPEILAQRIRRQPGLRPLIDGERVLDMEETRARVEEILSLRAPLYEDVSNFAVESGAVSIGAIADNIVAQVAGVQN